MMARASYLKKMTHPPFLFLFGGCFIGFLMTLSRISLAGFFLGLVVVLLVEKKHFPIWIVGILVVSALCFPLIESFSEWIMGLREGSTSVRFSLYRYSLEQLHDTDWILGLGVKPRENIFAIPLGSHSTYISMIFKTGVFGVTGVLLLQASLLLRWVRLRAHVIRHRHLFLFWRALGMVMIAMAVWMATEDIDAPQFLAFLYFSMIGCFEGLRRECLDGVS